MTNNPRRIAQNIVDYFARPTHGHQEDVDYAHDQIVAYTKAVEREAEERGFNAGIKYEKRRAASNEGLVRVGAFMVDKQGSIVRPTTDKGE